MNWICVVYASRVYYSVRYTWAAPIAVTLAGGAPGCAALPSSPAAGWPFDRVELTRVRYCWRSRRTDAGCAMRRTNLDCRIWAGGSPASHAQRRTRLITADLSPDPPPIRGRVLGCRHDHRDGVSRFGRAPFLRPGRRCPSRQAQPGSRLAVGHGRSRRAAALARASTAAG
jgi:hypothetical protein